MSDEQPLLVTIAFKEGKAQLFYNITRDVLVRMTNDFAGGNYFGVYEVTTADERPRSVILALRFADVLYIG